MQSSQSAYDQLEYQYPTPPSAQPAPFTQSLDGDGTGVSYLRLDDSSEGTQNLSQSSSSSSDRGNESAELRQADSVSQKPGSTLLTLISKYPEKGIPKEGSLTSRARKNLVDIWKCHILTPLNHFNRMVPKEEIEFWAKEITTLYPEEDPRKYYIPGQTVPIENNIRGPDRSLPAEKRPSPGAVEGEERTLKRTKRIPAKGILHDALQNYRKILRTEHPKPKNQIAPEPVLESVPLEVEPDDEQLRCLNLVKSGNTDNKDAVLWAWKQTLRERSEFMSNSDCTIKQIFAEYPCLHAPWGSELITQDFEGLYSSTADVDGLQKRWPKVGAAVLKLAIESGVPKDFDASIFLNAHVDLRPLISFVCLLKPITASSRPFQKEGEKERSKTWRPSLTAVLEGVFKHATAIIDVAAVIEETDKSNNATGLTQPYVIIVGKHAEPHGYYVVIENDKYFFKSAVKAVDVCFKAFWSLNIRYPVESERFYHILQYFCYNIKLDALSKNKISGVITLIEKELSQS